MREAPPEGWEGLGGVGGGVNSVVGVVVGANRDTMYKVRV